MTDWKPKDLPTARAFARRKALEAVPDWADPETAERFVTSTIGALLEEGVDIATLADRAVADIKLRFEVYRETLRKEAERELNRRYLNTPNIFLSR